MLNVDKTEKSQVMEKTHEATALLRADHKHVSYLFATYEEQQSPSQKRALVALLCTELKIHVQIEEEIFYPAVKQALKDKEMIPEGLVEHAAISDLIRQVENIAPDGEMFDAKIKVMSEYVKHHVKEEQQEMFPKAKASTLDMNVLGARMVLRKKELLTKMTGH